MLSGESAEVDRRGGLAYVPGFSAIPGQPRSMFTFLLVVHAIIAFALVVVILMQRSEGGGLGMGGSPSGLMSARGAADFLTRATTILATLFVALSITLAVMASRQHVTAIDTSLARTTPLAAPAATPATAPTAAPTATGNSTVPLAQ
ncbi:hypothetical protein BH09PSE4_BH09PSE4_21350 [soil metagenome]